MKWYTNVWYNCKETRSVVVMFVWENMSVNESDRFACVFEDIDKRYSYFILFTHNMRK